MCPLAKLPPQAAIHFIGVCGVAMAQLAVLLSERGCRVSGSDKEFYEPMGALLRGSPVRLYKGYAAENISRDTQLAVIGNAVSYGHPEVAEVEERRLPYTIFPKLLYELILKDRQSIVIAGTHGKTTTTALLTFVLQHLGLDPGYFIGGIAKDFARSLAAGGGRLSVVEGDEYDSAFFAKVPKFMFYRPDILVVTSVEYDHADIYPDLQSINRQFNDLVSSLKPGSQVVVCGDDANLERLLEEWKKNAAVNVTVYGSAPEAQVRLLECIPGAATQRVRASFRGLGELQFDLPLLGAFNAKNALSVLAVCAGLGLNLKQAAEALKLFGGVKRRQEVRCSGRIVLIEDFAHHPTAVRETVEGIRARHPQSRLWAVFEPRSNTSRRRVFREDYLKAFVQADEVVLCNVTARALDKAEELLDVEELAAAMCAARQSAVCLPDAEAIREHLLARVQTSDVVVVMSNGAFGGLAQALEDEWSV